MNAGKSNGSGPGPCGAPEYTSAVVGGWVGVLPVAFLVFSYVRNRVSTATYPPHSSVSSFYSRSSCGTLSNEKVKITVMKGEDIKQ